MINDHEACAVLVWIAFIHSSRVFVRAKWRSFLLIILTCQNLVGPPAHPIARSASCELPFQAPTKPPRISGSQGSRIRLALNRRATDLILRKGDGRGQWKMIPVLFSVDVHLELILPFVVSFISFKQSKAIIS
ncbi:uncharacterized protein K441DRAFT_87848 [Cenococcum geophilum 1.58]|uniref:uncharacterized protein n=1 Tax=Cenococcum geophilum 1.58 TaxID=794803 RepID=UPI00358EB93D|nr:hypothetical protein K441DRAFT_87848 [Cenococcum geophilum 1.58]